MFVSPVLPVSSIRDLTLLELGAGRVLVIACDSVGSIGPKPHDSFPASASLAAHCAVRVPLLEVIAAGAKPEVIIDALSVEMEPTGREMIEEIRAMAASIGLGLDRVTGSTEDNVPTAATGIGVTIIATADRSELRAGTSRSSDAVLCLGAPTSAPDDTITIGDERMISLDTLVAVLAVEGVHDVLPVGSRGVGFEIAQLAASAELRFEPVAHSLKLDVSGGPASCVLVSVARDCVGAVSDVLPGALPRTLLGTLS